MVILGEVASKRYRSRSSDVGVMNAKLLMAFSVRPQIFAFSFAHQPVGTLHFRPPLTLPFSDAIRDLTSGTGISGLTINFTKPGAPCPTLLATSPSPSLSIPLCFGWRCSLLASVGAPRDHFRSWPFQQAITPSGSISGIQQSVLWHSLRSCSSAAGACPSTVDTSCSS